MSAISLAPHPTNRSGPIGLDAVDVIADHEPQMKEACGVGRVLGGSSEAP